MTFICFVWHFYHTLKIDPDACVRERSACVRACVSARECGGFTLVKGKGERKGKGNKKGRTLHCSAPPSGVNP